MDDLIKRLRETRPAPIPGNVYHVAPRNPDGIEAADEIEKLTKLVEEADKVVKRVHDRLPPGMERMILGHFLMRC